MVANDLDDIKNNNHKLHLVFKNGDILKFSQSDDEKNPDYLASMVVNQILK